jgi:ABC-2 type transport system permease protein
MSGMLHQVGFSLRLHFRNRMGLIYGYLFPAIYLTAFWVLYRHERVPLIRHVGELLTVSVLAGACFGLPTTLVSERERGVWRRYRLAPVSSGSLIASTVMARYVLLVTAGLLQLALAMGIGMPLPRHPFDLWIAFTCVSFAFVGLGLVIAMMADNVPAVQALGQCIFLPMLIIGGVAVPLASLPEWAQHVAAFFPGRYAVEAIQVTATGDGLGAARFSVLALLVIGAAGCVAGAKLFRWDALQRFTAREGKGWIAVALAGWVAVGLLAESRGRVVLVTAPQQARATDADPPSASAPSTNEPELRRDKPASASEVPPKPPASAPGTTERELRRDRPASAPGTTERELRRDKASGEDRPASAPGEPDREPRRDRLAPPAPPPPPPEAVPRAEPGAPTSDPASWQQVTLAHIDRDLNFQRLPSDRGVVSPIAGLDEEPDEEIAQQLDYIAIMLPAWKPGQVSDPVQRVRNYLYVAAVPDVFQMEPLERFLPLVVFEHLQRDIPKDVLIKALYWIALHPFQGDDTAVDQLRPLGLTNGPGDMQTTRERVAFYAVKLLGRLTGKIVPR